MPKFAAQIDTMTIPVKGLVPEGGTAFPVSPVQGQFFHRTDQVRVYQYLGGSWHQIAPAGAPPASSVTYSGSAGLSATDVEAALDELDTEKASASHVHQAISIGFTPGGGFSATNVAAALAELESEKATPAQVTAAINAVVDAAPGTLDTLNELAAALGDDPNFATTMTNALAGKAPTGHGHALTDANITGVLPVAKGGTGGTTAEQARSYLLAPGAVSLSNPNALVAGVWSASIAHNMNSENVGVFFKENATKESLVLDYKSVDANNVQIRADVAFAANAVSVKIVV